MDLANLQPPPVQPPAEGSSCSYGGIVRGRAAGNVYNFGDEGAFALDEGTIKPDGRVSLAVVTQPPRTLEVDQTNSVIKVVTPCFSSMAPLLKHVSRQYSPVRSN